MFGLGTGIPILIQVIGIRGKFSSLEIYLGVTLIVVSLVNLIKLNKRGNFKCIKDKKL